MEFGKGIEKTVSQARRYSVCLCYVKKDTEVISGVVPTSSLETEIINQFVYAGSDLEALELSVMITKEYERLIDYVIVGHLVTEIKDAKIINSKINTNEESKEKEKSGESGEENRKENRQIDESSE